MYGHQYRTPPVNSRPDLLPGPWGLPEFPGRPEGVNLAPEPYAYRQPAGSQSSDLSPEEIGALGEERRREWQEGEYLRRPSWTANSDDVMSFEEYISLSPNERLKAINKGDIEYAQAMDYEEGYKQLGPDSYRHLTEPSESLPPLVMDMGKWYPEDQVLPHAYDTDVGSKETFRKRFPGIGPNENPYAYMNRMDEARLKQQGEPFIGDRGAAPPAGQVAPGSTPAEDMIRSQAPQQRQPDFSKISPLPEGEAADFSVTEDDRRRSTAQAFNDPSLWVPGGMMRMPGRETLVRPGDWKDTRMPGPNVASNHPANTLSPMVEEAVKDPKVDQRRLGTYSSGGQVDPNKPAAGASPDMGPGSPSAIRAGEQAIQDRIEASGGRHPMAARSEGQQQLVNPNNPDVTYHKRIMPNGTIRFYGRWKNPSAPGGFEEFDPSQAHVSDQGDGIIRGPDKYMEEQIKHTSISDTDYRLTEKPVEGSDLYEAQAGIRDSVDPMRPPTDEIVTPDDNPPGYQPPLFPEEAEKKRREEVIEKIDQTPLDTSGEISLEQNIFPDENWEFPEPNWNLLEGVQSVYGNPPMPPEPIQIPNQGMGNYPFNTLSATMAAQLRGEGGDRSREPEMLEHFEEMGSFDPDDPHYTDERWAESANRRLEELRTGGGAEETEGIVDEIEGDAPRYTTQTRTRPTWVPPEEYRTANAKKRYIDWLKEQDNWDAERQSPKDWIPPGEYRPIGRNVDIQRSHIRRLQEEGNWNYEYNMPNTWLPEHLRSHSPRAPLQAPPRQVNPENQGQGRGNHRNHRNQAQQGSLMRTGETPSIMSPTAAMADATNPDNPYVSDVGILGKIAQMRRNMRNV